MRACIAALAVLVGIGTSSPASAQTQPAAGKPVVTIERVENRFVLAPEAKVTEVDGDVGQLTGLSAGVLRDEVLFIGGAAYWLTGGASAWDLRYGGLVVGMQWRGDRAITFGTRGLIGIGDATRSLSIRDVIPWPQPVAYLPMHRGWQLPGFNGITFVPTDGHVTMSDNFFVFEPQADVMFTITRHIRFGVSGGYRWTGATRAFDDRLNGATGTVSVQFGLVK